MRKREIVSADIIDFAFYTMGVAEHNGVPLHIKRAIPGQKVLSRIKRKGSERYEGALLEVLSRSPLETEEGCVHKEVCGGCLFQSLTYEREKELKCRMIESLLRDVCPQIFPLPFVPTVQSEYRNKMEYTFGDAGTIGEVSVGLRRQGTNYEVVPVTECNIVDEDFRMILRTTLMHFEEAGVPVNHKMRHDGVLRNLVVRKGTHTSDIMINLVVSSESFDVEAWLSKVLALPVLGKIVSVLLTVNDRFADAVHCDDLIVLYGQDFFTEKVCGLSFRISPFSFFQTNTRGAELLYQSAISLLGDVRDKTVFDLYSGTGTISLILSSAAKDVVGVEIVPEAVDMARENQRENDILNCEFVCGDVMRVVPELAKKPDVIILDPPRDGVHHKAIADIAGFGVPEILYISCKPTSIKRDLIVFETFGYVARKGLIVDMFARTGHVETVVLIEKKDQFAMK